MSAYPEDPPKLAWGMWKRFLAATATIVLLTAAGSATAVLLEVDSTLGEFLRVNPPLEVAPGVLDGVDAGRPQTILVLGSDRRYDDRRNGGTVVRDKKKNPKTQGGPPPTHQKEKK